MALQYDPEAPAGSRIQTLASSGIHRCVCVLLVWCGVVRRVVEVFLCRGAAVHMAWLQCATR
jgi:hypothetical protein